MISMLRYSDNNVILYIVFIVNFDNYKQFNANLYYPFPTREFQLVWINIYLFYFYFVID